MSPKSGVYPVGIGTPEGWKLIFKEVVETTSTCALWDPVEVVAVTRFPMLGVELAVKVPLLDPMTPPPLTDQVVDGAAIELPN